MYARRLIPALSVSLTLTGMAAAAVTGFTLVNADADSDIRSLGDGDTIVLADLPTANINIRANVDVTPASVSFTLSGATSKSQTEGVAPYALWGDTGGNYNPGALNVGAHTLSATPAGGGAFTINFSVVDETPGQPTASAGPDRFVTLPANTTTLIGSGTDDGGAITTYAWTQESGPALATLSGEDTATLVASNLLAGTYTMRLTVTDNDGNTAYDEARVVVGHDAAPAGVYGELKKWHKVTVILDGPLTDETATPNPFLDYRLNVTFTHQESGTSYVVPGYYAADGVAAETSAESGSKWAVHFAPDATGVWTYAASFRAGSGIAVDASPGAGSSAGYCDGETHAFEIAASDKTGRDHRGKGRLQYVGEHYLRFADSGEYFIKQGSDAPENLFAYEDFDNTPDNGSRRKSWSAHAGDWSSGDPSWQSGKGTELIGAVNYMSSEGMNAMSFLTMSADGDDKNVFMWRGPTDYQRYDVSKCAQWEIVMSHMDRMGIYLHFKTQETENDQKLDRGALGTNRKLYYRELIARFGHHLALNWNLGEENTNTDQQRKDFAQYFHDNDPYRHNIVVHTYPGQKSAVYTPLLGSNSKLTGLSLQGNQSNFSDTPGDVATWVRNSALAGKKWVVAVDEPGDARHALRPDSDAGSSHVDGRKHALWGTLMSGGAGCEYYFGYDHAHSDLTCQDFRSRDQWWDYCRYALQFFASNSIPVQTMVNSNSVTSSSSDYCFLRENVVYVVYLRDGGTTSLDLSAATGAFDVQWSDPRNGGALQNGSVTTVSGGGIVALGTAPSNPTEDWVILVRRADWVADADSDGIDDNWERERFGNLSVADGNRDTDYDGDGSSDLHESLARTDPKDAESLFMINALSRGAAMGSWDLAWKGSADVTYGIHTSSVLSPTRWGLHTGGVAGAASNSVALSVPAGSLLLRVAQE